MATRAATDPTTMPPVVRSAEVEQGRTGLWATCRHMAESRHSRRSSTSAAELRHCGLVPAQGTRPRWTGTPAGQVTIAGVWARRTPRTLTLVDLQPVLQGLTTERHHIPRQSDELHRLCGLAVDLLDPTIGV